MGGLIPFGLVVGYGPGVLDRVWVDISDFIGFDRHATLLLPGLG